MIEIFIGVSVFLFLLILFFILRKKKKITKEVKFTSLPEKNISVDNKKKEIVKEFELTVLGTDEKAKRTSRNRQMLLMEMSSYDEVILELSKEKNNIWVLNENRYDIGYLSKEDRDLILPYIENNEYSIETGVERFFRSERGESLIIYVTVLGFI